MESTRAMTCEHRSRAEAKNCEIPLFPTADRRFGRKVKCPTRWASFRVKFSTVRSGFGIDWYINVNTFHFNVNRRAILSPCSPLFCLQWTNTSLMFTSKQQRWYSLSRCILYLVKPDYPDSSNTRATEYILCTEKQEIGIVLPVLSPGLPKNGGWSDR